MSSCVIAAVCGMHKKDFTWAWINGTTVAEVWMYLMADLHDDVTYEGWGKTSMVCHRECLVIL